VIGEWETFFAAQAGASAALAGLVFVALSINLREILASPALLPGRAAEAIVLMVLPVFCALVVLIPNQSLRVLGIELLILGGAAFALVNALIWRSFEASRERSMGEFVWRIMLVEVALVPTIIAGALLVDGSTTGLDWQAFAALACLAVGISDAWVLLIEILR
jgi:modulator of FtsH protease